MRHFIGLLFLTILTGCYVQTANRHLFQISENEFTGYIDQTGQVVIKPTYRTAGEFSEELAAVRIDGTYGYIDKTGNFVIEPQFDYATDFKEGIAIV